MTKRFILAGVLLLLLCAAVVGASLWAESAQLFQANTNMGVGE